MRVLVIDDNEDSAETMAVLLRVLGHEAGTAYTPLEALRLLPAFVPDVIFLDIKMPQMSGVELARRIRTVSAYAGIGIIAHTAYGIAHFPSIAEPGVFDAYLPKPATVQLVQATLGQALLKSAGAANSQNGD